MPVPPNRGASSERFGAVDKFGGEVGEHLVSLRERQEMARDRDRDSWWKVPGGVGHECTTGKEPFGFYNVEMTVKTPGCQGCWLG